MMTAITHDSYTYQDSVDLVFRLQTVSTIPLYRAYSEKALDHFYTTNQTEMNEHVASMGYAYEGISAYVYASWICGSTPLYRLYSPKVKDHFYTTVKMERKSAMQSGYKDEGIACNVVHGF